MDQCTLKFPGDREITFSYPKKSHIPRVLNGVGIQSYEPLSQAAFLAAAESRSGPVFDIGSNIGIFSMVTATALGKTVYAYEPFAEAAAVLRKIASDYALPIHVTEAAISDTVGERDFYLSTKSDMSNSLNAEFRNHRGVRKVPCLSVDSEAADRHPCAIKIDTETTEIDVLEGAVNTLAADRPAVLIEVLDSVQSRQIRTFFDRFNYSIVEIGGAEFQGKLGDISDLDTSGDARNWLALPDQSAPTDHFMSRVRDWIGVLRGCKLAG